MHPIYRRFPDLSRPLRRKADQKPKYDRKGGRDAQGRPAGFARPGSDDASSDCGLTNTAAMLYYGIPAGTTPDAAIHYEAPIMQKTITVTATGDSLFVAPFPAGYRAGLLRGIADFIASCDIRITNLETNLSDFEYFPSAYSGGTWLNTRREYLDDLLRCGFNCIGTANNHVMDYSCGALLSTVDELDRRGLAHAGTGRSLAEAARPAILKCPGGTVAVFAVDTSFHDASRAGQPTAAIKARPGVNYLRHTTAYPISPEEEAQLRAIAGHTGLNFTRDLMVSTGFYPADPEGVFVFGGLRFTTRPDEPKTRCNAKDKARLLDAIRDAGKECDAVFLLIHCHDDDDTSHDNPPAYLKEFCRAAVDAGAAAVFGGGCHSLRGIELHRGAPIFYSLGDFIYQGLRVEHLPADFMEKFDADVNLSAREALMIRARGGKVGLHCQKENYLTVLPKLTLTGGAVTAIEMMPVSLNFDRKDDFNGLPAVAPPAEAAEILAKLRELSAPFGTEIRRDGERFIPFRTATPRVG